MGRISRKIYDKPKQLRLALVLSFSLGLFCLIFGTGATLIGLLFLIDSSDAPSYGAFGLAFRMPGLLMVIIGLYYFLFYLRSKGSSNENLRFKNGIGMVIGYLSFFIATLTFFLHTKPGFQEDNAEFGVYVFPLFILIVLTLISLVLPTVNYLLIAKYFKLPQATPEKA